LSVITETNFRLFVVGFASFDVLPLP